MSAQLTSEVNYCLRCGGELTLQMRFGRMRPACENCGWVYFADPKVAAAALIMMNDQVLLVKRAVDPQHGKWTLPAGFVDAGEDPAQAVVRECFEETGLQVQVEGLLDVMFGLEHPRGAHILIVYRVTPTGGELHAGDDVDQATYFSLDQLPPLAFRTTTRILQQIDTIK